MRKEKEDYLIHKTKTVWEENIEEKLILLLLTSNNVKFGGYQQIEKGI